MISFVKKCGHTARQRGRISTPFPLRKAVFTAGKECSERESTLQAAQIPVCGAAAVPLRSSALIKRASP